MNNWTWGWDALVAIGTLLLAAVTVASLIVPACMEKSREKAKRDRRAHIFALLIVDELGQVQAQLASLRAHIANHRRPDRAGWLAIAKSVEEANLAVFRDLIDRLEDCPDCKSRPLAEGFASLMLLKSSILPMMGRAFDGTDLTPQFRSAVQGLLVQTQHKVNVAFATAWNLAARPEPMPLNPSAQIDAKEIAQVMRGVS